MTGATGALGRSVVTQLLAHGYDVRALVRRPVELPAGVVAVQGDLLDANAVAALVTRATFVIHMAARVPGSDDTELDAVNVRGTRLLVESARAADVERVVLFSSVQVYGAQSGRVDEATPPKPDSAYGRSKLAAEATCTDVRNSAGAPLAIVLRFASVYGPNMKGGWASLLDAARAGWLPALSGGRRRALIHSEDAARAALAALTVPRTDGPIFNVTDGGLYTPGEIIAHIYAALGRRPHWWLPARVLSGTVKTLTPLSAIMPARAARVAAGLRAFLAAAEVVGDRFQAAAHFEPTFDLAAGWRQTVRGSR